MPIRPVDRPVGGRQKQLSLVNAHQAKSDGDQRASIAAGAAAYRQTYDRCGGAEQLITAPIASISRMSILC